MHLITVLAGFASVAAAYGPVGNWIQRPSIPASGVQTGTFEQLIDHSNPSLGTFSQRYWYNGEFYKGPGSPVVLASTGESAGDGDEGTVTNSSICGAMAQAIGGGAVMLEHRYYGQSSPFAVLDTKNLQYLTLNNTISDHVHFAKTVKLPFDSQGSSSPDKAPWVLVGGSYDGALSAWTEATQPGTFWAYHASSAPVQAISDFYTFFNPISKGMPQNCSKDIDLVTRHMDQTFANGTSDDKQKLKTLFGLQDVEHDDDFMMMLGWAVSSWQVTTYSAYPEFYHLCDSVEGVFNTTNATVPGAEGVGLDKALQGYANYISTQLVPGFCSTNYGKYYTDPNDLSCLNSHNESLPLFADRDVDNAVNRQWQWFLCNEPFAWWQDGTVVSSDVQVVPTLVTADYWQRQCDLYFPKQDNYTYGSAAGKTVDDLNKWTGGWDERNRTRVVFTNGEFDPWRSAGVSSEFRPGGPEASTTEQPINIIKGGVHCFDWHIGNTANPNVRTVVDAEIAQVKQWVSEFKPAA